MSMNLQPIYMLASGGSRAMEQLDVQANNLANVSTPGFKKLLMNEMTQKPPLQRGAQESLLAFPRFNSSRVIQEQGTLVKTESPNDVAISGSGYLEVRRGNETVLTRQGRMRLDPAGFLQDDHGNRFLDTKGKPIRLDIEYPFTVAKNGTLFQEGEEKATLSVKAYAEVAAAGEHYYRPAGTPKKAEYTLNQGYLESSNLNATQAMVSLIESQRRFDIYGNMIRSLDQLEQKVNEIGKA